jgi:hypothetical protein
MKFLFGSAVGAVAILAAAYTAVSVGARLLEEALFAIGEEGL